MSIHRATSKRKRRVSGIENRYSACLCDLIRTDDFNDTIPIDGPSRLIEAARPCESHKLCCPSCQPGCQARTDGDLATLTEASPPPVRKLPARRESPPPLMKTCHFPSHLHPIPRHILPEDRRGLNKAEFRLQEKQSWQLHQQLIHDLFFDPYDRCICDVIGLEDYYQVVKDPDTLKDYPHRPDCLPIPISTVGKSISSLQARMQPTSHASTSFELPHGLKAVSRSSPETHGVISNVNPVFNVSSPIESIHGIAAAIYTTHLMIQAKRILQDKSVSIATRYAVLAAAQAVTVWRKKIRAARNALNTIHAALNVIQVAIPRMP